ncbi:MAG: VRR-NUC domain-containing protein [Actinomycetota bacterium]|nr:VRR-NUC domain-containing protein [Actinomycetota bacterium]
MVTADALAVSHLAAARKERQARLNPWQLAEAKAMSETKLQTEARNQARILRLLAYHTHDSRRSDKGFPDLVVVGPGGVLYRELKDETGVVSPDQVEWLVRLVEAGVDAGVWRPTDLVNGRIDHELAALRKPAPQLKEIR